MFLRLILLLVVLASATTHAQGFQELSKRAPTELPNFSLIGIANANFEEDTERSMNINEIEFAYQSFLFPNVKADVFAAFHLEEDGSRVFELEESYVTFLDLFNVLTPQHNLSFLDGTQAIIGRKFLNFGKVNSLHPEQWDYSIRPEVLDRFLGGTHSHGIALEGVSITRTLPVPFFAQLEVGVWDYSDSHAHGEAHEDEDEDEHEEEAESAIPEYGMNIYTSRLWTSFALSEKSELELGSSAVLSAPDGNPDDQVTTVGGDITYTYLLAPRRKFLLQAELLQTDYHNHAAEVDETLTGGYVYTSLDLNQTWTGGLRYDGVEGATGLSGYSAFSVILRKQLTETSQFRFQYVTPEDGNTQFITQFVFGFGPHAHVLQ